MSAHTPGPWTFARNTSSTATVTAPRRLVNPEMVQFYGEPDAPEALALCRGDSEIRKANARLIAAAPDLLAACLVMLGTGEGQPEDTTGRDMAKAAVAKAIGGQP